MQGGVLDLNGVSLSFANLSSTTAKTRGVIIHAAGYQQFSGNARTLTERRKDEFGNEFLAACEVPEWAALAVERLIGG